MTSNEIKQLELLLNNFKNTCLNICKQLILLDYDYTYCYKFTLYNDEVCCEGYYTAMNESEDITLFFPKELLTFTFDELENYVNKKLKEKEEEKSLLEKRNKELQEEKERKEYERLKKKYG